MRELSPRGRSAVVGGLMLALGLAMLALARAPVQAVVALAATGLLVAGAGRLLGLRDAGPWRAHWLDVALGSALLLAGATTLLWRSASLRLLAWVFAGALVASGVVAMVHAVRGQRERRAEAASAPVPASDRAAGVLGGLTTVVLGALVLLWPRLSLAVLALVVGVWLAFAGLGLLVAGQRRGARRRLSLAGTTGSLVVALALAAGTLAVHSLDPREEPDAFYTPPLALPDEPGRLLRAEPLAADRVPAGARAWRILFTSSDGAGRARVASGTVLAPESGSSGDPGPEGAMPVLSVAHGTTGVVPRCAPSLARDPFAAGPGPAVAELVREGWVAVTTDYVGLGTRGPHGYLVGPDAARNVLDATRAARELEAFALSGQTVVWGHSQGGHAALWTGIEAPSYAPELEVLGVAALAPAADLVAIAGGVRATTGGKLVSAYLAASWSQFYGLDLEDILTRGYGGIVERIQGHCFDGANVLGALAVASQLTEEVFRAEAWDSELVDLLVANTPAAPIDVPVLVAQGDADRLVLVEQQREFVARRCAAGQAIDYREYVGLDHVPLVEAGSPLTGELLAWTRDRLAGRPGPSGC